MKLTRQLSYTIDTNLTQPTTVFLVDKHAANFFKQVRIYCNDTLITKSFEFVFEINLLRALFSDADKNTFHDTYAALSAVLAKNMDVCDTYFDMNDLATGSVFSVIYNVIIPMTIFNLLSRIRYLPTYFGTWKIEIIPTLDNMVSKVVDYNGLSIYNPNAHANCHLQLKIYNVGTINNFVYAANANSLLHYITSYQIRLVITEKNCFSVLQDYDWCQIDI
ncbi:MAG: hypothetical protein Ta2E_10290 [Mycoplasmoidaceae bacterium]|nr:MAG: hypothetical protein Ta2E_10290 [Mycoplasmoidaceae bacterium]